jgi:hypothetical protein
MAHEHALPLAVHFLFRSREETGGSPSIDVEAIDIVASFSS